VNKDSIKLLLQISVANKSFQREQSFQLIFWFLTRILETAKSKRLTTMKRQEKQVKGEDAIIPLEKRQ
ncbi:unnamed protein product, partial [Brassica oleracea]